MTKTEKTTHQPFNSPELSKNLDELASQSPEKLAENLKKAVKSKELPVADNATDTHDQESLAIPQSEFENKQEQTKPIGEMSPEEARAKLGIEEPKSSSEEKKKTVKDKQEKSPVSKQEKSPVKKKENEKAKEEKVSKKTRSQRPENKENKKEEKSPVRRGPKMNEIPKKNVMFYSREDIQQIANFITENGIPFNSDWVNSVFHPQLKKVLVVDSKVVHDDSDKPTLFINIADFFTARKLVKFKDYAVIFYHKGKMTKEFLLF